jgi:hypothetical protein
MLRTARASRLWSAMLLTLLLAVAVQGLSLVTLLTHAHRHDHSEAASDCHPVTGDPADGCDPSCSCLGCPAHAGGLALFPHMPELPTDGPVRRFTAVPLASPSHDAARLVFRPPSA